MSKRIFDLRPIDGRKSFYGKATVTEYDDGTRILRSYTTEVAAINPDGQFVRLWDGESATTTRHVNAFLNLYSIPGGGVAWWRKQAVNHV